MHIQLHFVESVAHLNFECESREDMSTSVDTVTGESIDASGLKAAGLEQF